MCLHKDSNKCTHSFCGCIKLHMALFDETQSVWKWEHMHSSVTDFTSSNESFDGYKNAKSKKTKNKNISPLICVVLLWSLFPRSLQWSAKIAQFIATLVLSGSIAPICRPYSCMSVQIRCIALQEVSVES